MLCRYISFVYLYRIARFSLIAPLSECVHHRRVDDKEDTTARAKTQDLGQETLVERSGSLFAGNGEDSRPGPVVLGRLASDLGGVLNTALDYVHGRVQDGTNSAADRPGDEVVGHLLALGVCYGQHVADLVNDTEVTGVPENVAPQRALQTLVDGEGSLVLDDLADAVNGAAVSTGRGLVLQADLDELEGDDDEGLGGTGRGTGENGQTLVHLLNAENAPVELAPLVVGGELCRTLGGFHHDGGADPSVQAGGTGKRQSCKRCDPGGWELKMRLTPRA